MKRAILIRCLWIVFVSLVISGLMSAVLLQRQYNDGKQQEMQELLNVISISDSVNSKAYPALAKKLITLSNYNFRITFIAPDGKVLGDSESDPAEMENHKSRPEVASALKTGYGENLRNSSTLGIRMLYIAQKMPNGDIARISANVDGINSHILTLLPGLLFGLLVSMIIAPLLAWKLSETIVKPFGDVVSSLKSVNAGNYAKGIGSPPYAELAPLTGEINCLARKIAKMLEDLTSEKNRISYLLDNMSEGLVVLDRHQKILIINHSALAFFNAPGNLYGANLLQLTHTPKIIDSAIQSAENGAHSYFDVTADDGRILQILMSPVTGTIDDASDGGVILLITDVSAIRRSEQIRSEFIANASHELKTPLTSIKGFAELIGNGFIQDEEQVTRYLTLIRGETDRMISLIDDILKLSELESITAETGCSKISLALVARKVKESLSPQASAKNVEVNVIGDNPFIRANGDRMEQLLLNLMDNAIKYNVAGGRVEVLIKDLGDKAMITVSDTGVGIPEADRERVFERFYRVDKSHSRKIGGTGLGLSIVKHICALYKGKISLRSELGHGTVISVTLPK